MLVREATSLELVCDELRLIYFSQPVGETQLFMTSTTGLDIVDGPLTMGISTRRSECLLLLLLWLSTVLTVSEPWESVPRPRLSLHSMQNQSNHTDGRLHWARRP